MLTASEIIEYAKGLQAASYKTIDQYLCRVLGINFDQVPFYGELKAALGAIMVRVEVQHPAGYTMYEWHDRD